MSHESDWSETATEEQEGFLSLDEVILLMLEQMKDGLDHPEIWDDLPAFAAHFPNMRQELADHVANAHPMHAGELTILLAMCIAVDDPQAARDLICVATTTMAG